MVLFLAVIAIGLSFFGWLWIVVMAFQDGETTWGVLSLICGPVSIIYGIMNFGRAKVPLAMIGGGVVLRIVVETVLALA